MGPAFTWAPFLSGLILFTVLHWGVLRWVDRDFLNALKLSRGVAAVLLTVLGMIALFDALDHHATAFVYPHAYDDWMRVALLWVLGHFVADFVWMAWGNIGYGAEVRWDLAVHHLLGVIAFLFALKLEAGYALGLIVMITEVLPVSTGIKGLARTLNWSRLEAIADRSHLQLLLFVRLPLWIVLLTLSLRTLSSGHAGDLQLAFQIVTAGLIVLIVLDVFWSWHALRSRKRA